MSKTLAKPPRTIMDVFNILPEGTWVEIIDDKMTMLPSFTTQHQSLVGNLLCQIAQHVDHFNLGEVMLIIDVFLDDQTVVLPDLSFINIAKQSIIQDKIRGVPDLIVEVLSPGNKDHDLMKKKELYERFGVQEYWTVDQQTKQAQGFGLRNKIYELLFERTGIIKTSLLNLHINF